MIIYLLNKDHTIKHEFDIQGPLQNLQRPDLASTSIILYKDKHYVFQSTLSGGRKMTFTEADIVEITPRIG